jgi:uncharacterized protein (UPF0332 family)
VTSDITVEYFEFDEPTIRTEEERELEDWYDKYLKRSASTARWHCTYCGAFITKEQAMVGKREAERFGSEWEPTCEPGKGCMK